ncbi:AraC family transcriptional regulator [Halomonas halmophila]|uniref:Transcriptional regulator n=1 Tax=Halomonas halmophila TaxID=252 RepID=A0A4Y4F311_9GAMM|nr:AraC family transcriptional regulator [Halomonas halmophila]GED21521.1 transcriptional regulator [Halomonas halmophila]
MPESSWVDLEQDSATGIETVRAHFQGHAYDPHWHDSYLVGVTEQGLQQFTCRHSRHRSTPGRLILIEPGEVHDGHAPEEDGFTYSMLYLDPDWLDRSLREQHGVAPTERYPGFSATLADDPRLSRTILTAFSALRQQPWRIMRDTALDQLIEGLVPHLGAVPQSTDHPRLPAAALRARDYLHAHVEQDISLEALAVASGVNRYRLSRAFKQAFGIAPHAYLVQLRLNHARRRLAAGETPVTVASQLGFADQSHLGRWFRRAYGVTPADYRQRCRGG